MRAGSYLKVAICAGLIAITWEVFGQTLGFEFVNYDDNAFVCDNPDVNQGLTMRGTVRAFTRFESDNWHPLTTISHMIDCQLFDLKPGGHHFMNVLLHGVAVVFLFVLLYRMTAGASRTGGIWPSAFVAAIFAIHPLHVESVAWVAERKDVLSGVFFMLTLGVYLEYTRHPPSLERYPILSIMFVCGLMSKPILVTLPIVLLLLDYWPLRRISDIASFKRCAIEKIPLLVLSLGLSIATMFAQSSGAVRLETLPLKWRVSNALVASCIYIRQMFWPTNMAVFYPHPGESSFLEIAGAATLLVTITVCVFRFRKQHPYLVTGWCWYLVVLLPVIGLIQVGGQAHADRYTYLSQIGLYLAATWWFVDLMRSRRYGREILGSFAAVIILMLIWRARVQTSYWVDSEALWKHALAVTSENDIAHLGLGEFLSQHHRTSEAISEFRTVLMHHPNNPDANFQLGWIFAEKGDLDSAAKCYQRVLTASDTVTVHCALGDVFSRQRRLDDARAEYNRALLIDPKNSKAESALASLLLYEGHGEEAIEHYRNVVRREPSSAVAHYNLAVGLHRAGKLDEAIVHYKEALARQPDYPDAEYFLKEALAQSGQSDSLDSEKR